MNFVPRLEYAREQAMVMERNSEELANRSLLQQLADLESDDQGLLRIFHGKKQHLR